MRNDKGTDASRPINVPSMTPVVCEHQWFATTFEVKEHFPNGQIKKVQATAAMCLKCGEGKEL